MRCLAVCPVQIIVVELHEWMHHFVAHFWGIKQRWIRPRVVRHLGVYDSTGGLGGTICIVVVVRNGVIFAFMFNDSRAIVISVAIGLGKSLASLVA